MKCHYCATYATTPQSLRKMVSNPPKPKISHRYCRHIHKDVTSVTDSCIDLTPAPYFWCKKWSGWVHVIVCLVRRKRKIFPCVWCKQYREIEDISIGRDMFKLFEVERKPIKVSKTYMEHNKKVVLKRRKMN